MFRVDRPTAVAKTVVTARADISRKESEHVDAARQRDKNIMIGDNIEVTVAGVRSPRRWMTETL